jgi:PST family polysaccharide transporter
LRAEGHPVVEFGVTLAMTLAMVANTALTAPHGLYLTALGYLLVASVTQIGAALPALRMALPRRPRSVPLSARV